MADATGVVLITYFSQNIVIKMLSQKKYSNQNIHVCCFRETVEHIILMFSTTLVEVDGQDLDKES